MIDRTFIDALSSKKPTPGGGGASAYAAALAASLAAMVANLTVGKKAYAAVEADMYVCLEKLGDLTNELIELIEADARAFEPLAKCYGMPKMTSKEREARDTAMQLALVASCEVPLRIMQTTLKVLEQVDFVAQHGSRLALSDAGAAAALAQAAVSAASLSVFINISSMTDDVRAAAYTYEAESLIVSAKDFSDRIFSFVVSAIR